MAEPPDFDQIARRLLEDLPDAFLTRGASVSLALPGVVEQLRQVWNARGAADGAALKAELQRAIDLGPQPDEALRPTIALDQMIKALDR